MLKITNIRNIYKFCEYSIIILKYNNRIIEIFSIFNSVFSIFSDFRVN